MGELKLKDAYKKAFEGVVERLKATGKIQVLEGAEDLAELLYKELKEGLKEGAELSKEPWDDIVVSFLPTLDKIVDPAIDNINKSDNG